MPRRVAVALLLLLPVTACSDESPAPSPDPEPTGQAVHAPDVVRGLSRLLDRRADAVRADDAAAFLGGVDASDPDFVADQETYFANLEQLPVGEFGYTLDPASLTRTGRGYWAVVDVTLELDGYDEVPVVSRDRYRFTGRHGHYRLASVGDPAWEDAHGIQAQPWDEGEVVVRYGSGVLGIFDSGSETYARDVVADVETGLADVSARVPYDWEPRVVLYALADPAFLDGLPDLPGDDPQALDAVAFPVPASPEDGTIADTRFLLNPEMLEAKGDARTRLIRHELTHVAVGSRADDAPTWLNEGIAEYVSVQPMAPEDQTLSEEALAAVENGTVTGMPDDDAFVGPDAEVAYAVAWWACEYLAATYDEELLWLLLESMGSGDPDEVLELVVGTDADTLARRGARLIEKTFAKRPAETGSPSATPTE